MTTDGSGNATFNTTLSAFVRSSAFITATATDQSTNETSEFGAQFAVNGPVLANDDNGGYTFDGIDDYVAVAASASLTMSSSVTLEALVRPTTSSNATRIILNKEGEYEVAIDNNGFVMWAFANSTPGWAWHNTGVQISNDTWSHIAITYNGGVVNTYVNGELAESYSGSGTIGDVYPAMNELRIGGRTNNPANQYFAGEIDDVRVWNTVRTQSEIVGSITSTLIGSESGLVAYYKFDGDGTTSTDATSNNNHGILGGGISAQQPVYVSYTINENSTLSTSIADGLLRNGQTTADGSSLTMVAINGNSGSERLHRLQLRREARK